MWLLLLLLGATGRLGEFLNLQEQKHPFRQSSLCIGYLLVYWFPTLVQEYIVQTPIPVKYIAC